MDYQFFDNILEQQKINRELREQRDEMAQTIAKVFDIPPFILDESMYHKPIYDVAKIKISIDARIDEIMESFKIQANNSIRTKILVEEKIDPEVAALRVLNILLENNGYEIVGRHVPSERIMVRKRGETKRHLFLPQWFLPKVEYDTLLWYLDLFMENSNVFGECEEGYEEDPF